MALTSGLLCYRLCIYIHIYVCVYAAFISDCVLFSVYSLPRREPRKIEGIPCEYLTFSSCVVNRLLRILWMLTWLSLIFFPRHLPINVLTNKQKSNQPSWSLVVIAKGSSRSPDSIAACDTLALLRFSLSAHLSRSGVDSGNSNRIWRLPINKWRKKSAEVH